MTCVVGIQGKDGVLLAADSQISGANFKRMDTGSKVFQLSESMAVAYCGSGRFGQIMKHFLMDALDEPPVDRDLRRWYVRDFAPVLRNVLADNGFLHIMDADQTEHFGDSAFLLAVRDRLFSVEPDFSINESEFPFEAQGSGTEAAMGALTSGLGEGDHVPGAWKKLEGLAGRAIRASAETTPYVGGTVRFARTCTYTVAERAQAKKVVGGAPTTREDEGWYL